MVENYLHLVIAVDIRLVLYYSQMDSQLKRLIKKYGKSFTPALLPNDLKRWPVGKCFDACAISSLCSGGKYQYVEGIASAPDGMGWILHAWLTEGGSQPQAFDPTWRCRDEQGIEYPMPVEYIGIVMPIAVVAEFMRATGYQGVIANRHRAPALADQLMGNLL